MKKEFNCVFFLNHNQVVNRVEVKTATLNGNPAFAVEGKHEFFPGRFERVIFTKTVTLSEDAAKEAVKAAYNILKAADRIAYNTEGQSFFESVARRLCEGGYSELTALESVIDRAGIRH